MRSIYNDVMQISKEFAKFRSDWPNNLLIHENVSYCKLMMYVSAI